MNRNQDNNRMLIGIIAGAALILMTMIASLFIATRRPVVVVVPSTDSGSRGAALPAAVAPATTAAPSAVEVPPVELKISKVDSAPSTENPLDPFWDKIAASDVAMLPQQVAQPMLADGSVSSVKVQAVHDATRYVWRVSWDKAEVADRSDVGEFSDAVAMQFPLTDGAPYTMGGPNMPVRMLHWKATWQKDIDEGFQDIAQLEPNADADLYWFAKGEGPYSVTEDLTSPEARQYMVAAVAGNPMSDYDRKNPVEELTAHGFGSATHIPETPSHGRGAWKDGRWYVVIDRPIDSADPLIGRFNENPQQQLIAFAVWDGTESNRGGRKNITNWTPMRIDP